MSDPDISPHVLASLVAISDHGSLSAAARHRNLTQPSLSRQVQELEARLDTLLVERSAQGARLTPAGEALVDGAREILTMLNKLPERVKRLEGEVSGRVRIGCIDSVGIYVLPPLLAQFIDQHPLIDVQVVCQSSPQLLSLLLGDELDIAIGTIDHPKIGSELLYQDRLVLVYPEKMPEDKIPERIEQLSDHKIITFAKSLTVRKLVEQCFDQAGVELNPVMELTNIETIKAMVRSGIGIAILPEGCVDENDLATTYIHGLDVTRGIRLLYRNSNPSLATQELLDTLRSLTENLKPQKTQNFTKTRKLRHLPRDICRRARLPSTQHIRTRQSVSSQQKFKRRDFLSLFVSFVVPQKLD